MKLNKSIKYLSGTLLLSAGLTLTSCEFLDIVPPEQADMNDATITPDATEGFLYSCYANIKSPIGYYLLEGSADEFALPEVWGGITFDFAYDRITSATSLQNWNYNYKYIGQIHLFLENLPAAKGIPEQQRSEWEAEP